MLVTNFKLIRHGLPTNAKFKNRYDNSCFMCKKIINENTDHVFVHCEQATKFF